VGIELFFCQILRRFCLFVVSSLFFAPRRRSSSSRSGGRGRLTQPHITTLSLRNLHLRARSCALSHAASTRDFLVAKPEVLSGRTTFTRVTCPSPSSLASAVRHIGREHGEGGAGGRLEDGEERRAADPKSERAPPFHHCRAVVAQELLDSKCIQERREETRSLSCSPAYHDLQAALTVSIAFSFVCKNVAS